MSGISDLLFPRKTRNEEPERTSCFARVVGLPIGHETLMGSVGVRGDTTEVPACTTNIHAIHYDYS